MKVMHLGGTAILGRTHKNWFEDKFREDGIDLRSNPDEVKPLLRKGLVDYIPDLIRILNEGEYDWVFFGWELFSGFNQLWNHNDRRFKVLIYAQEQPQSAHLLSGLHRVCDVLITSSPTYQEDTDGFIPFPAHTAYMEGIPRSWEEKEDRILISGSFRQCRYELFKRLLEEQPFDWPVYFLPSALDWEPINRQAYIDLIEQHPKFVAEKPRKFADYIPALLRQLDRSKFFIDLTFNPTPEMYMSQGHSTLESVLNIAETYQGGYMPERVLDACFYNNIPFCFQNPAISYCLGDLPIFYSSYEELVDNVSKCIKFSESDLSIMAEGLANRVWSYATEEIIMHLSHLFRTGSLMKSALKDHRILYV